MRSLKVLVAEDNAVNQMLALALLKRREATVTVAHNGLEAVELWSAGQFDLVLMDIQMPEMDGLDATRLIRAREMVGEHTPIIALTARAMTGDREECLAAGMDAYLSKPLRAAELMALIDRITAPPVTHGATTDGDTADATFDVGLLRSNVGGDEALIAELLALFFADAPRYVESIHTAVLIDDCATAHLNAHALKGAANAIAAFTVAAAAGAIEQSAHLGTVDGMTSHVAELRVRLSALEAHVRALGFGAT